MNRKPFSANLWPQKEETSSSNKGISYVDHQKIEDRKTIDYYFPGTSPLSNSSSRPLTKRNLLQTNEIEEKAPNSISKTQISGEREELRFKYINLLKNYLQELSKDAHIMLRSCNSFNKTLKTSIFDEFISYAESKALHFPEIENGQDFWDQLHNKNTIYHKELLEFCNLYCFRVAIVYICKLRFIAHLCQSSQISVAEKDLLNPSSFLSQIFRRGSSTELISEAFKPNCYSWYRPGHQHKKIVTKLSEVLLQISISDILGIIVEEDAKVEELVSEKHISHALAHHYFGEFLNLFLIDFPQWKDADDDIPSKENHFEQVDHFPKIVSCKYFGQQIESLSMSYWPTQSLTTARPITYVDFADQNTNSAPYYKICHELEFLTSLVGIAKNSNYSPVSFICSMVKKKRENMSIDGEQISMFSGHQLGSHPKYDRVLLLLTEFPKNNPHFYLINQINQQAESVKESGLIFAFSTKKLFVPSQSDKVDQLLKRFRLEGIINLENLRGREDIPAYVYIFSKKTKSQTKQMAMLEFEDPLSLAYTKNHQENRKGISCKFYNQGPCLNFNYSGELNSLNQFSHIISATKNFFESRKADITPLFQSEISENINFEFYQDVIVDGRLINSAHRDSTHVTHPAFFKNIMTSCIPLDHFFHLETFSADIDTSKNNIQRIGSMSLIDSHFALEERYPYVLVVNFKNSKRPKLEIIPSESYPAKAHEYGHALSHYFGLTPKRQKTNINLFREYFESPLGEQIIQLSLTGNLSKLKAKTGSVLVPKFFDWPVELPDHILKSINFLTIDSNELISFQVSNIKNKVENSEAIIRLLAQKYPWKIMGLLAYFKRTLLNSLNNFESPQKSNNVHYTNPLFIESLLKAKKYSIYPNNDEYYFEFKISASQDVHRPLTQIELKCDFEQDNCYLSLISQDKTIVNIYSDPVALNFLKFIFSSAHHSPISSLLQNTSLPKIYDLKENEDNFKNIGPILRLVFNKTSTLMDELLKNQINQ